MMLMMVKAGRHIMCLPQTFISRSQITSDHPPRLSCIPPLNIIELTHKPKVTLEVIKTGRGIVKSAPVGIDCGAHCSRAYDFGTNITLTVTPDANNIFIDWAGKDCTRAGKCIGSIQQELLHGKYQSNRQTLASPADY